MHGRVADVAHNLEPEPEQALPPAAAINEVETEWYNLKAIPVIDAANQEQAQRILLECQTRQDISAEIRKTIRDRVIYRTEKGLVRP